MAREINLVPDIKGEMIRTLKLRNLIFFLCIVVALGSIGVVLITGLIVGGQQLALDSKAKTIDNLSTKLNSYSDLNDFLTIKDQVGNISTLSENKQVMSRTFNILSALLPTGADTITISELNVDLSEDQPTWTFDAQANAGAEPFYDYRVLDAFKKSMQYMRYDYGNYVDKEGNNIPAYCMIETGDDGAMFNDADKGLYAYWLINGEGCNPSSTLKDSNYTTENYNGETVVRIWRTPQFADWYKEKEVSGQPYMSLDGTISNVEHFDSACITYTGDDSQSSASPKWTSTNEQCKLISEDEDAVTTTGSSNGRNSEEELVLRFSAIIKINPEAYKFTNTHMMALAPSGRHNVTDSYVQVQAMFGKRADDCDDNDSTCQTTPSSENDSDDNKNTNGGN